jgi:hypothetical protein
LSPSKLGSSIETETTGHDAAVVVDVHRLSVVDVLSDADKDVNRVVVVSMLVGASLVIVVASMVVVGPLDVVISVVVVPVEALLSPELAVSVVADVLVVSVGVLSSVEVE